MGQSAQGCAAEAEKKGDASNTTSKRNWANQDDPIRDMHTRDDRKEAVIGRSQYTAARKLERGITPDGEIKTQGGGARAAPLPDNPLSVIDELPLPLLDCGQGKESYATVDTVDGELRRRGRTQTGMSGDDEHRDKPQGTAEELTANKDCIPASDASRLPNSVDLPRSETTHKPPSVAPPSGEPVTVNAGLTANRSHSPPEKSTAGDRRGGTGTRVNDAQTPIEQSAAAEGRQVKWRHPIQCSAEDAAKSTGRPPPLDGIQPPILLATGKFATGAETNRLRLQNKRRRHALQYAQIPTSFWTTHKGTEVLPLQESRPRTYRNEMCPAGIAPAHPAGPVLAEWSKMGCPTRTGKPWTKGEMWEAVERGPHKSSLTAAAIAHFAEESAEKVRVGQAKLVLWEDIKDNPPPQLKVSPIMVQAHKSKAFRSILDLSFRLRLRSGGFLSSVNEATVKLAPQGALDQLGHALSRIIHAFAEAEDDAKIFMAKWDIKDGFWRMDCAEGEEYNFAYVLPQEDGKPITLVVPTSLQMGWVESPPYFCAATETARDIADTYCNTPVGSLPDHKFIKHMRGDAAVGVLPERDVSDSPCRYCLEVYVDDFMSIVIPTSREQLDHVATAVMTGIHDVFPANIIDGNDPISEKKLLKGEGQYSPFKTLLGFDFDGDRKTLWLEEEKRAKLLTILHQWLRATSREHGIPFIEFESVVAKLRHAFTALPGGRGLLSPCNRILKLRPQIVYFHRNEPLRSAISNCRTLLRESTTRPTRCRELVAGWPDYVGVVDASSHGVGGVIIGELSECKPTVFRLQWPPDITASVISESNPKGTITNSDLELAGLVILWLMMEHACGTLTEKRVALFSDNSPTVSWVQRMASRSSLVAEQLIRVLALRFNIQTVCPITTLHIAGDQNAMTDIPSRSFGSEPKWHFKTDIDLLTFFNATFPLPQQNLWTVCRPTSAIAMRVISVLRMTPFTLDDWRRLPAVGKSIGTTGNSTRHLWEWTLIYRMPPSKSELDSSQDSRQESARDTMAKETKSRIAQSVARLRPLARRSPWPAMPTL